MSTIRRAVAGDLPRLIRTATLAFVDDPLMRWFYPDRDEYFEQSPSAWRHLIDRSMAFDATFTTDDGVALGVFAPPGRPHPPDAGSGATRDRTRDEGAAAPTTPDSTTAPPGPSEELLARFGAIRTALAEHTPPEPHWYLNLLATHPDWQRQGLGAATIAPIGDVCRREGLALYLETQTIENVAYYTHLGFRVRSELDVALGGPHMWGMIRRPD